MSGNVRRCPACAEEIPLDAEVCPFCSTKITIPPPPMHDETSEFIVLPIKGEGINLRLGAVLVDFLLLNILYLAGMMALFVLGSGLENLQRFEIDEFLAFSVAGTNLLLGLLAWFFYFFLSEALFGATPGKASSSLVVLSKDGGRLRWWQAAVRALLSFIEYNPLGAIVILATPRKQRLGDLLAGTLVVHKEKIYKAEFHPPAMQLEFHDRRRVTFAEISEGTLYKFGMIRQLLLRGRSPDGGLQTLTVQGHFFRPEFDMLRLNIENRYNIRFPEKIILWRLALAVFSICLLLSLVLIPLLYLDRFAPLVSANLPVTPTRLIPTIRATSTPKPTATPRPTATSTPEPVEVTFDTIGEYPEGRLIIFVGRLSLMSSTRCDALKCGLLLENPAKPNQSMTIFVYFGDGPNKMKPLPDPYTKSDIQVQLDDGTFAVVGYRIRITGRVCQTTNGQPCITDITKIELYQVK